jgi:hypothetical protein
MVRQPDPRLSFDLSQNGKMASSQSDHPHGTCLVEQAKLQSPGVDRPITSTAPVLLQNVDCALSWRPFCPGRQVRPLPRTMYSASRNLSKGRQLFLGREPKLQSRCRQP